MNLVNLRPVLAPLAGAILCVTLMPRPDLAGNEATAAQFVARALSPADGKDAGPIEIVIRRWSSDADVENLRKSLGGSPSLPMFTRAAPEAAVVLVPGVQSLGARVRERRALPVEFAREIATPAGRQIVIATDQHLGFGELLPSRRIGIGSDRRLGSRKAYLRSAGDDVPPAVVTNTEGPQPEFTLLDIRIGPDGKGVGKTATAANVVYNHDKKIFEIKNYDAAPVRLSEVRPSAKP
jgi:hypothetical protein